MAGLGQFKGEAASFPLGERTPPSGNETLMVVFAETPYSKQQFIAQFSSASCILRLIEISGKTSEW
jgi:hypothetical protein